MPQEKKIFIEDLSAGNDFTAPFLVLSQSMGRTSRGGLYLNVELGDKTGEVGAKVWDNAEDFAGKLPEGKVSLVRGYVDSYRGNLQLVIREARVLAPDEISWEDYIRSSPCNFSDMKASLYTLIASLKDDDFRRLTQAALDSPEVGEKFLTFAAAKKLHHAYFHGLLEHSLSVGKLAASLADHYPKLNRDLLICGALLHDLGKVWEFTPPPMTDYSTVGRLKGHLVMGVEFLGRVADELPGFPPEKLELLQHIILSHHGEPEFGAPVRPQLLEALVVHHLDNIDAKLEAIGSFLDTDTDDRGWSNYHRLFGGYYLRTPQLEPAPLEEGELEKPLPTLEEEPEESLEAPQKLNADDEGWLF